MHNEKDQQIPVPKNRVKRKVFRRCSKLCPYSKVFSEHDFIKKQIKAKIQLSFKKSDKKWKNLFEAYQGLKTCTNKETFSIQENKFLNYFCDLIKDNANEMNNNFQTGKKTIRQSYQSHRTEKSMKINLQKIKLMKQNELLRKKCLQSTFKSSSRQQCPIQQNLITPVTQQVKSQTQQNLQVNLRLKEQIKQLNQKIYELENENIKMKQHLVICEDSLRLLKDDKNQLSKKITELKSQNENFCSQFVKINLENENSNLKLDRWRAVIAFQREEILSYQTQFISIKNQYKDLMRKYKILVKRLNSITTNNETTLGSNGFGLMKQSEYFTPKYLQTFKQQLETFNKIRMVFYNKQSQNTLDKSNTMTQKKYSNTSATDNYKPFLSEKETLSNTAAVKKLYRQNYSYFKPNFYNFVQSYMDVHGIDSSNMEQLGGGFDLNCDFLTTIRSILDSKFNDFLQQNFTRGCSLANFTYAWLSKYKIHRKQKKIISIKGDIDKDVIPNFFMNLMSQKLNCNWQIIAFREFLMDSLTVDELYFYLMARNFIFQGGLLQNMSAVYQQIYYISITNVLNLMQRFITDVNYRRKVEQYIKRFVVYIRKRPLIDVHFILRILLEYYQSKKHQQFTNLSSLAEILSKQKASTFTFQSFLKIFQYNFAYLSLTEKLDVYKKCFSCSRGKINLQIILTVLTEDGYLCKEVKKIFCNEQILLTKDQSKAEEQTFTIEPEFAELLNFENFFQRFYKDSYTSLKSILGLQHFQKTMDSVKDFNQDNIFQRIELVFGLCLSTLKKLFYTKKIGLVTFMPILQQTVEMLKKFNKITCEKKEIMDLMNQFKRESAAKKILRFYKKKRNQMHRNFIFGVKDEVIEEEQKMQSIRKEFNFIIENLKDKFSQKNLLPSESLAE